ncbi:MAG: tetratricopeptide repeat protein [Planctomycetes bacterium]|nr:tetratricopeptide repeat protein [Planctomycetota bacterium]
MQRYRVNYQLLIGLFVGGIVLSITLFFLWRWQVSRKAIWYHERSQVALEEDDKLEAFDYLRKFVRLRRENEEARVELASIAADIAVMDGVSREEKGTAFQVLSETVRRTGDSALRRKLADLQFKYGRPQDAITHLEELLKTSDDSELQALYVRSLFLAKDYHKAIELAFDLIGYNKETKEFNVETAAAPEQPELYSTLAGALMQREKDFELARQVIDQMAAVNPDSAVAHLQRSIFLYGRNEKEEAAVELEKAFQLDPEDVDVLFRKAAVANDEKNYEDARRFASEGIEKSPDEMRFYRMLASIELGSKRYDEAIAALDQAVKKFGMERSIEFILFKIDILLSKDDVAGTEEVIRDLEKLEISSLQPLIDFQHARIKYHQGKWAEAAKDLARVRPQLAGFGRTQSNAGRLLGDAYLKLGKLDLARQVFEIVVDDDTLSADDPIKMIARAGIRQIDERLGLGSDTNDSSLTSFVRQMLARPEDEQDWQEIDDRVNELVESRSLSEVQRKLLQGQVFSQRKMLTEAKQMVRDAVGLDPDDVNVRFAAVKLLLLEAPAGPPKALELLKRIETDFGTSYMSRRLMAEALMAVGGELMAVGGEDILQQLRSLAEGTEDWTDLDRMKLLATIGLKFLQLNELDEALQHMNQAAELDPSNLPLRIQLFDIAFQQRNDDAMREAQEKILELVGSKDDGNYVLTEVKRLLIGFRGDEASRVQLQEARRMLDDTLEKRPQWHELHVLYGQVLWVLQEDMDLALQHLNDALKYGRPNPNAVALLVRLFAQRGDFRQAQEKMELIPVASRGRLLGRVEASILLSNRDKEAAFESAQKEVERHPEDASTQAWFGGIAELTGNLDAAATAYRKTSELNPLDHENWMKLVAVHARRRDSTNMETTLRAALLALDPEHLPLIQAKFFELQGSWTSAEDIYKNLYEGKLDDPGVARRMAAFYLLWALSDNSAMQKAVPHINLILRAANEGPLKIDEPNVLWARERAARILAATGSYQDSLRAQRLLKQGSVDGTVPRMFQTLYGEILSSRTDPASLLNAIDTLSVLNQQGLLEKEQVLLLAKLYAKTNNWKKGNALMLDALSRYGADPEALSTYIVLLIGQGEYTSASQRLKRLAEIASNNNQVFQLRTLLAYEQGNQAEVNTMLRSLLPPNLSPTSPLDENQLNAIRAIAAYAMQYGEYEFAEQLFRLYSSRKSEGAFDLLTVMALHGDVDKALPIMEKLVKEKPVETAQLAVQLIRQRRAEFGDRYDDAISQLVLSVWKDAPDVADRLMFRAEMYEVTEKFEEAISAYEQIIDRDDLPPTTRAIATNNLAYLLALRNQRLDEAQELVDRAIIILGPLADVLDTRAVIRMARKEYDLAVEDMTLSLSIDPTAVKYYHMAKAQALAGNEEEALEAWEKAEKMDIEMQSLPLIEQPSYRETEQMIEKFRS